MRRIERLLCLILVAGAGLLSSASARVVDLPPDGAELNRTHVQFRWDSLSTGLRASGQSFDRYRLEIVEDDGSDAPFQQAATLQYEIDPSDPRLIVTDGLTFDKSYAWRVHALGADDRVTRTSETSRFTTIPITPYLPALSLVVPPGAAPVQPGLTCWTQRRNGLDFGFIFCVEESGELVLQYIRHDATFGDMRFMDNGRLVYARRVEDSLGQLCRYAEVATLDGKTTWGVGKERCDVQQPFFNVGVHHEVFPMPMNSPRGSNFILLEFDPFLTPFEDIHDGASYDERYFYGDRISEYDRHARQPVKSWSTLDAICLDDHLPPEHPSGWGLHPPLPDLHHGNAAVYDELTGRLIVSARRVSRILVVDWESGETLFQFGETESYPGGPEFPCGDVTFGDDLFSAQHAPEIQPNGNLVLYDNGNFHEPLDAPRQSRAIEIAFDDPLAPTEAWIVSEYRLVEPDLRTPSFGRAVGDADRMPNGNFLTINGLMGYVIEADSAGNTIWHLSAGVPWPGTANGDPVTSGTNFYRAEKISSLIVDTPGDTDGDWDLDLLDLAALQATYAGFAPARLEFPATLTDHDADGKIDSDDVEAFVYWMTGPAR